MGNYVVVRNVKRRKLNSPYMGVTAEGVSLHQLNIFTDKMTYDILSENYFYCANRDCYKIKETARLFCANHTVYNTTVIKKTPLKIHPSVIKDQINLQAETLNADFYISRHTF